VDGWVKLHRKFRDWEWYKDINTKAVFLELLLIANIRDCKFRGQPIPRGSALTTYDDISSVLSLTKDEVRTAIKHLKSSHTITTRKFLNKLLVTICNYSDYQAMGDHKSHTVPTQSPTHVPHGSHTVPTPNEEEGEEYKEYSSDATTRTREADMKEIISRWEALAGTRYSSQVISDFLSYLGHMEADVIVAAIDRADKQGIATFPYIRGILEDWAASGVCTIADVEREAAAWERKKQSIQKVPREEKSIAQIVAERERGAKT